MDKDLLKYKGGKTDNGNLLTPAARVSFPSVFEPKPNKLGGAPKYTVTLLFPKNTDLSVLKEAMAEAVKETWGEKPPKKLKNPIKDGDESHLDSFKGHWYVEVKSSNRPEVIDLTGTDIISKESNKDGFYGGCYARCTLRAFTYDKEVNKGVALGLQNIQKLADGEPFGGKSSAASDFGIADTGSKADYNSTNDPFDS